MRDIDFDVPRTDVGTIDETKERELKLEKKMHTVKDKLKKMYFFTSQQLHDVFNKNVDQDRYFFDQIIRDVEQQYNKISLDIPINDYLYDTLMSIHPLDEQQRKKDIVTHIDDILDGPDVSNISYMDFLPHGTFSEAEAWKNMKAYVKNTVQDFYVVHIHEDVSINKNDQNIVSSKMVKHYLSWSKMMGINFFVFVQKDGRKRIAVGVQKGTTGVANDAYFDDLAKKYNATQVEIPLSHFVVSK